MKLKAQIETRTKKNLKKATNRADSASKKLSAATKKIRLLQQNKLQSLKSTVSKQKKEISGLKFDFAQQICKNAKLKKTVKAQETRINGFNEIRFKAQQDTAKHKLKHQELQAQKCELDILKQAQQKKNKQEILEQTFCLRQEKARLDWELKLEAKASKDERRYNCIWDYCNQKKQQQLHGTVTLC